MAFVLGAAVSMLSMPRPSASARRSPVDEMRSREAAPGSQPRTLHELIAEMDVDGVPFDIARANLLCATDLPGSEELDIADALAELDTWSRQVQFETERHMYKFRQNPADYENSEPYFRMLMLTTVLQQDCGVRYNPERVRQPDFRDAHDLFIHGLLGERRTGTCVSMPVLSVAVGRRLGYPLKLALAKSHVFVRWDDGQRKPLNFETTSLGLQNFDDEYYAQWPEPLPPRERASGAYLRSLSPDEELAVFLHARGHCLFDNGRLPEAQVAYAQAHVLAPAMPYGLDFLAEAVRKEADAFPEYRHASRSKRSPMRTADDVAARVNRINAENASRLRDTSSHVLPLPSSIPSTSIPNGGMP